MKKLLIFLIIALSFGFHSACGESKKNDLAKLFLLYPRFGDTFSMVQFSFPASKNQSLSGDAASTINDTAITVSVPHDADMANLIAEFTPSSEKIEVKVNGVVQKSGETKNDYTSPVVFNLTTNNENVVSYTVTVNRNPSGEKSILAYSLNGSAGVIDNSAGTIAVDLPPRTALSPLIASFSTSGTSVLAGGADQTSGVTPNDFSHAVTYTVTAEDGSQKQYTVTARALPAPWKAITSFSFLKEKNTVLAGDVHGIITGTSISVELPFGSVPENLIASYDATGQSVAIGGIAQESGVTVNTFTSPRAYRVTAEDTSTADYDVTVTVAKSGAKSITSFTLDGERGAIDEAARTITVDFPVSKNLNGLIADFVMTGVTVSISGAVQTSGMTANDFSNPVPYDVIADNGSINRYTVTAVKKDDMAGLWNFESSSDSTSTVFGAVPATGITGQALQFDGYDDYMSVPDSDVLTLGAAGTVEAVFWISSHRPFAGIVHKGTSPDFSDEAYSLQFWIPDGTLRFSIFNDAGAYVYVDSPDVLATGQWYHCAATWDSGRMALYINGSEVASTANTAGAVRNTAGDLVIGAQLTDQLVNSSWRNLGFNGNIDRVQLYSRALTADEVAARYNSIIAPGGQALAAYLLSAVSNRGVVLVVILVLVAGVLFWVYMRNRRETVKNRQ